MMKALLIVVCLTLSCLSTKASAQQPCSWNYSLVNGEATATFCGNTSQVGSATAPSITLSPTFAKFFAGGLASKKIVFWGDSVPQNANEFFTRLATYAGDGQVLSGLVTTPANYYSTATQYIAAGSVQNLGNIYNYGNSGATLAQLIANTGSPPFPLQSVCTLAPDLVIVSAGVNDVRQGATTQAQLQSLITTALAQLTACLPATTQIMWTDQESFLLTDVGSNGFVVPNTATCGPSANIQCAQWYSDIMRNAAAAVVPGSYPNVSLLSYQTVLFGPTSQALSPYMLNQIHPGPAGRVQMADILANLLSQYNFTLPSPERLPYNALDFAAAFSDAPALTILGDTSTDQASLGSELTSSTGWTSTGWTGSYGTGFTHTSGNTSALSYNASLVAGLTYQLTFIVGSDSAGTVTCSLGGATPSGLSTLLQNGTYSCVGAAGSNGLVAFTPSSTFNGTISSISAKLVTQSVAAVVGVDSTQSTTYNLYFSLGSLNNLFEGEVAGSYNTTGYQNTFFGAFAGNYNTTGFQNLFIGYSAGSYNTNGFENVYIGNQTASNSGNPSFNTYIGNFINRNGSGGSNTVVGGSSMPAATTANDNVGLGYAVLGSLTTGYLNTALGYEAAPNMTTGSADVCIGPTACDSLPGSQSYSFVSGASGYPVSNVYFGNGYSATTPSSYTINGTSATGTNTAGGDIHLKGGNGNGTGNAGRVYADTPLIVPGFTIASLPTCSASYVGARVYVTNAQTSPTFLGTVSTTGTVTAPVFCNGTAWVYGMLEPGNDNAWEQAA